MSLNNLNHGRFKAADSLRAALLSLISQSLGDDFLELVDCTAPSEQRLDSASWLTAAEEDAGQQEKLDELTREIRDRLAQLGMRGVLYLASDAALLDERNRIRARLYGDSREE